MEKIVINMTGDGPKARTAFSGIIDALKSPGAKSTLILDEEGYPRKAFLISVDFSLEITLIKP